VSSNKGNEHRLIYSNSEISDEFLDKGKPSNYIGELITMLDKQECNMEASLIMFMVLKLLQQSQIWR
jgi:hypothetical protein